MIFRAEQGTLCFSRTDLPVISEYIKINRNDSALSFLYVSAFVFRIPFSEALGTNKKAYSNLHGAIVTRVPIVCI